MTWTTTPPTETGDYRWRESDQNDYVLVRLFTAEWKLVGFDARESWPFSKPVLEFGGEWEGPLVEPQEADKLREIAAKYEDRYFAAQAEIAELRRHLSPPCGSTGDGLSFFSINTFPAASQLKALEDEQSYQRPLPDGSNGGNTL